MRRAKARPDPLKLFQGEMMMCVMCGKSKRSDPHVESGWTAVQADWVILYCCPACFGNIPDYWQHHRPARPRP